MSIKFSRPIIVLVLVIIIASLLRLTMLGQHPIHLTNDEAALGYNAYSILQTGRDEHAVLLPMVFKSFGDWKPGFYIYLTTPSIIVFGLTEFAVRFPSALFGVLAVAFMYVIGRRLFDEKLALLAAFSLAIMPWHIHFSRGAWEANVALTLLLAGIWAFLKSLENNNYLPLSAIFFGLTLLSYQSAKLASFLPLVVMIYLYRKKFFEINKKTLIASATLGILISIPVITSVFSGKSGRIEVMSVFSYTRPEEYIQETVLDHEDIEKDSLAFSVFHSETYNLFRGVVGRYFNYFSGRFLFFEGDWSNPKHTATDVGYILLAQIPILFLGAWTMLQKSSEKKYRFIFLWLLLAPIPAALTRDSAHGVRALNLVAPLAFAIGIGLNEIYVFLKDKKLVIKTFSVLMLGGLYLYTLLIYLDAYYIQNPFDSADNHLYGYKQVVQNVRENKSEYEKIVFDQSFDQPYIFFLFYEKYPPRFYQANRSYVEGVNGDVGFVSKLDNIEFRPINWSSDKELRNTLLIGKETAFPTYEINNPENYNVKVIEYPNGNAAFYMVAPL